MAVCQEGVYVANRHDYAQITYIYYWNNTALSWSPNLALAGVPFAFLPNPPVVGDFVLFGMDSWANPHGPWASLIFDLSQAITDVTGIEWRHSGVGGGAGADPATWQTFAVAGSAELDNTNNDGHQNGVAFDTLGIRSVHWSHRLFAFWGRDPQVGANPALGVSGFWACAYVTASGGTGVPPIQQNRGIYSVIWPYVETPADTIGGDLPAVPKIICRNESDAAMEDVINWEPILFQNKVIIGARSVVRKGLDCSDFSAFLNATEEDTQNPAGVTYSGSGGAHTLVDESATGYCSRIAPVGASGTFGNWAISAEYAPQYYGRYHAYLLATQENNAIGDITIGLTVSWSDLDYGAFETEYVPFTGVVGANHNMLDLGEISLGPNTVLLPSEQAPINIFVQYRADVALDAKIYTLVLMPVDEWAGEYVSPGDLITSYSSGIGMRGRSIAGGATVDDVQRGYIVIDPHSIPRIQVRCPIYHGETGQVEALWRTYGVTPKLRTEAAQRLWFLQGQREDASADPAYNAPPELAMSVELLVQQRYSSMRGTG